MYSKSLAISPREGTQPTTPWKETASAKEPNQAQTTQLSAIKTAVRKDLELALCNVAADLKPDIDKVLNKHLAIKDAKPEAPVPPSRGLSKALEDAHAADQVLQKAIKHQRRLENQLKRAQETVTKVLS